jgi:hypothetical protein
MAVKTKINSSTVKEGVDFKFQASGTNAAGRKDLDKILSKQSVGGGAGDKLVWVRSSEPDTGNEFFKFTIDTRQTDTGLNGTDKTFIIPTGKSGTYNWWIDWGDGSTQTITGSGATNSAGISKSYTTAGQYQITIRPAGSLPYWFRAFGFSPVSSTSAAHVAVNKNKVDITTCKF